MNRSAPLIVLALAVMPHQQPKPQSTGPATTNGPCSVAVTGPVTTINIYSCGDVRKTSDIPGEPIIDMAIGEIFGNPTLITVKNAAQAPALNAAMNLRCLLVDQNGGAMTFFAGFDSIEDQRVWWKIGNIDTNSQPVSKDSLEFAEMCLKNKKVAEDSMHQPNGDPTRIMKTILVADLTFQKGEGMVRVTETRIATLGIAVGSDKIATFPLEMSEQYRHLLSEAKIPSFR